MFSPVLYRHQVKLNVIRHKQTNMKAINLKKITIATAALIGLGTAAITTVNTNVDTTVQAASSKIKISQSSAVKKFKSRYNVKIESINLEKENGRYVYEIEGFSSTRDYEMKINASNGKVISARSEKDRNSNKKGLSLSKTISRSTATKIAQNRVPGSKAIEWTLERENSRSVWEVTVTKNGKKSEVKINALTKKVISVERD